MFHPDSEIRRLQELMPASGRMFTKIVDKPEQRLVIDIQLPLPWQKMRPIAINFDLWQQLPQPQRDLLLLRAVNWLIAVQWFKPDVYQAATAVGLVGTLAEFFQGDLVGLIVAGGLTAIAANQVWQLNQSPSRELEADEAAIRVAVRRGYNDKEAARHLLEGIEAVAKLERRGSLNFTELLRSQNLRARSGASPVGVPNSLR